MTPRPNLSARQAKARHDKSFSQTLPDVRSDGSQRIKGLERDSLAQAPNHDRKLTFAPWRYFRKAAAERPVPTIAGKEALLILGTSPAIHRGGHRKGSGRRRSDRRNDAEM
jgi:hypothetical protein